MKEQVKEMGVFLAILGIGSVVSIFSIWYMFNVVSINGFKSYLQEGNEQYFFEVEKLPDGRMLSPFAIMEYNENVSKLNSIKYVEVEEIEEQMSQVIDEYYKCADVNPFFPCNDEDRKLHNKQYNKNAPIILGERNRVIEELIQASNDDVEKGIYKEVIQRNERAIAQSIEQNIINDEVDRQQAWEDGREERIEKEVIALREEIKALKEGVSKN